MILSKAEYDLFYKVYPQLMVYAGIQENVLPKDTIVDELMELSSPEIMPIRDLLYDNIKYIDEYIKKHGNKHSEEELDAMQQFKHFKKGAFYVMQLNKKHAVFMNGDYAYAVCALGTPFEQFFGKNLPAWVETVLLPFKGKIIYDGLIGLRPVHFGRGIRDNLKNDLNLAKGKYGLIENLPISNDIKNKEINSEENLLILMKTKASREQNYYEIEELLEKNPKLYPTYYREWGRINARKKKKELKELGIKNYYFAIYIDTIVCSGKKRTDVEKKIKEMLKGDAALNSIYYFKV